MIDEKRIPQRIYIKDSQLAECEIEGVADARINAVPYKGGSGKLCEYINVDNLWHKREEEPTEEGAIIKRLFKKGEIYLTFFNWVKVKDDIIKSHKNIGCTQDEIALYVRIAWKECGNFDKWCYLSDLLPKGGEE